MEQPGEGHGHRVVGKNLTEEARRRRIATLLAVCVMGLGMPPISIVLFSMRPNSEAVKGALFVASYFELLMGFVAGCAFFTIFQNIPKRISIVFLGFGASFALLALCIWLSVHVANRLNVDVKGPMGIIGLVCSQFIYSEFFKKRIEDENSPPPNPLKGA